MVKTMHCHTAVSTKHLCAICNQPHESLLHYKGVSQGWPKGPEPEQLTCTACLDPAQRGGPDHFASPNCESGKRPHCSCDTCY